jgi:hypothetical protein
MFAGVGTVASVGQAGTGRGKPERTSSYRPGLNRAVVDYCLGTEVPVYPR